MERIPLTPYQRERLIERAEEVLRQLKDESVPELILSMSMYGLFRLGYAYMADDFAQHDSHYQIENARRYAAMCHICGDHLEIRKIGSTHPIPCDACTQRLDAFIKEVPGGSDESRR